MKNHTINDAVRINRFSRLRVRGAKFIASALGLALAFTGLTVATSAAPAIADGAGLPFSCTSPTFFAQAGDATTTQLYTGTFATATGQSTWTALGALNNTTANNYNAMALNPVNKYLYGVVISGAIVRIDSAGTTTTVGQTTPTALGAAPNTLWDTGAFDPSGNYYVADGNAGTTTIYKISGLDTGSAVRSTITLPASISFADLTWKDGYLWGHSYGTGSGTNFYRIDVSTPTASVVTINSAIIPAAAYGAAYTITNGNLSFISNSTMYQVAVAGSTTPTPTLSLVNSVTAPTNARADATNCLDLANADLKITKTGPSQVAQGATINWTVTVHNNGPGTSSGWVVKDTLPATVTSPTATSSNATCVIAAPTITCSGGTLASGADAVIAVSAVAPTANTTVTNSAIIQGYEVDPTAANSSSNVTTTVGQTITIADDAATTPYITPINVNVASNDTFTGGGVTAVSTPTNGTTSINADGTIRYTPKANFSGTDTFTYTVTDGTGQTGTATVTMTVTPLAVDDSTTTPANTAIDIPVTGNDKGQTLTLGSVAAGANTHGTVTVTGNSAHYVPTTGFSGTATFTYVLNGAGGTSTATVTVLVTPTAGNDALTTTAGTPVTDTNWATNDAGSSLTVTGKTNGSNGTVSIATGTPVYTPNANFSGTDTFTYTITDSSNQTATATVTVTVNPKANDDAITTNAGTAVTVPVLTNDKGTTLSVTAKTNGSNGTVSIATGTPVYTPNANFSGTDTFTYTITDGANHTSTATVTVTVKPVANSDAATTEVGDPVSIPVRSNDLGSALTVTAKTDGAHGTVSIATGTPVYTPAAGYTGSDTFTYTVTDSSNQTSTATVTVSITPGPTAANDTATTPAQTPVTINVLSNDTGTGLTVTSTTQGANGSVSLTTGTPIYTPNNGFSGTDTFTYAGKDAANHPISATVTVTVTPVAVNDADTVVSGGSKSVAVTGNDLGSGLTVTAKTNGAHGTVSIATGTPVYASTAGYSGTDTFTYTVTDSSGKTSTATVTMTINPLAVNDAVTTPVNTTVPVGVLANDLGSGLTVTAKTDGAHGTVSIASGTPSYTPATDYSGSDTFTYTITDSSNHTSTATVTVTITPLAVNDSTSVASGASVTVPVTTNDHGTTLTVTAKTNGTHGTVVITGGLPVYTANNGYSGTDSFTYTVTDASGQTSTATVSVTVTPVAAPDTATTVSGDPVTIDVLANDLGIGNSITSSGAGAHGTTSIVGGKVVYTPAAGYVGTDTFSYTITDANGKTSSATVAVTMTAGPSGVNDTATTPAQTAVTIDVLSNDSGTGLTLTGKANGSNGTTAIVGGKIVYTPTGTFSGTDTFTYTGKDSTNHPINATVTVTVTPTATDDTATVASGSSVSINVRSNDVGSALTVTAKSNGSNGTVAIVSGSPVYTPTGDFSGTDTFTYTVTDSSNQTASATVTVTVTPRAVNDTDTTPAETPVTTDVLANDHGTTLTISSKTNGTHGTVAIVGGTSVYTPASGFSGVDTYTYTATDATGNTAMATVTVTVTPKAVDDSASVVSGDSVSVPVKSNDIGTSLVVVSATNGAHGTVSVATGTPVYTSTGGYTGTDTFTYVVSDGTSSVSATVMVTVTAGPTGLADSATTDAGVPVTIDVLANDSGTGLTLTGKTNGAHGTVAIVSGRVVYTPADGFSGVDTFTYSGKDATNHPISATVTVTVDPKAVNDVATVTSGSSVSVPVLLNDLGSSLSVTDASDGAHGTVSLASGSPVYSAAGNFSGSDSFTYQITDGTGNTSTATVSVTLNPKAIADTATTPAGTDVTVAVLDNDLGSGLNVTATTNGTHGTVTVVGGLPVYSPATTFSGQDTFTYTITDSAAHTSTATVTVTVTPKANADTATVVAGDSVSVNVTANDLGTGLTVTGSTDGAHGTVSIVTGTPVYTADPAFVGTDTFTYEVTDGNGTKSTATVTVTVTAGPTALADSATTPAQAPVTIDVLSNDSGTGLTLTGKTNGANGTVAIVSGKVIYTPTGTFSGEDTFTYMAQDSTGHPISATVTVTVLPVAKGDTASVVTGASVTVTVLANDIGSGLTVTDTTDGAHGTVAIVGGKPVYSSDSGLSGQDTFTYEVTDGNGKKSSATVTVTVAPLATDDTATTDARTPVTVDVLANDKGASLDVLTVSDGTHGTVSIIGGSPVYTPTGSYSGSDTFTYTVEDADGTTSTATVTVAVNPVAKDDSAGVVSGESVTVPVLTNDIGSGLAVTATTDGAHGTVAIVGGKPVYTSDPGYTGTDTFTYTVTDSTGTTATATVTVTVASGPMGIDDTATTVAGTPATIDVLSNDIGTGLTLTGKTNGSNGTVAIVSGQLVYTPATGFSGTDTFTYTGQDAGGTPITATVVVTVDPKAKNDTATVNSGSPVTVPVLANDLGTALLITGYTDGGHGTVALDGSGNPVYTADPDFSGTDTFSYTVTDATGNSSTATVTVTVKPKANPDARTTPVNTADTIDVLPNDTGSGLTITGQADGLHGSVALVSGTLVYTPVSNYSGTDTFTYQVTDSHGTTSSTVVTVTITPTAGADTVTTNANTAVTVTVLTNDHGRTLTVTGTTDGSNGTVAIVGGKPVYTPTTDFTGTDTFTYTVTDAASQTATATVTMTILPKAVADTATTTAGSPVTVDVTANDAGTGLDVSNTTDGSHGTVGVNPDGTVTYTPTPGYSGPDTFTYTVTDGTSTATATVTVSVKPAAVDDVTTTTSGTAVTISPLTNDSGSTITVTAKTNGSNGTVGIQPGGTTVLYTPAAGFSGTDTFTYTITDANGLTATATVTVTVTPVAVDDSKVTGVNVPVTINAIANDLGTAVTITDAGNGSHGTVTIVSGKLVYTPDNDYSGNDSFVYTITDGTGQVTTATVNILVTPLAPDDGGTTATGTAITVDVLANDTGTGLVVTSVTQPAHGTVTIVGNQVVYTPTPGYSGDDTFTYTSTDSNGKTAVGTVTIAVTPVAANNTATGSSGSSVTLDPSGNDTGSGLTTTAVGTPSSGSVVLNPDGTITFTPDAGFSGTVTIPYTTTDTSGQTATAVITITIKPAAKKDKGHTKPGKPITTPVLGNDSGSGLHVTGHTNPKHGSVVVNADGTITYTPDAGFSGTDTYTYTVTDSSGQSVTTTVTIVVDAPLGTTGLGTNGLAFTGSDPTTALALAGLLLALGAFVIFLGTRRRHTKARHL